MSRTPDDELTPLAEAVSDGTAVDWDAETARHPGLGDVVRELQVLETMALVYRNTDSSPGQASGAAAPRSVASSPPEHWIRRWGPLLLVEQIGAGGFGEVYRAYDPGLQRDVALKLVRGDRLAGEEAMVRFLDEARRLARVRHDNVVVVHGVDRHDEAIGIWTDLIPGQTLETLLSVETLYGAREATHVGIELCRALAAVHAAGLVHRDIKTTNVMRATGGRIVLMDFGAASETTTSANDPGHGTPLTTAPEVLRGEPATPAADIYSLGVLLYRLTTGRFPFEASDLGDLKDRHARDDRILLRTRRPDLPAGFVAMVETALRLDPGRRYASAAAMERALMEQETRPPAPVRWPWYVAAVLVLGVIGILMDRSFGTSPASVRNRSSSRPARESSESVARTAGEPTGGPGPAAAAPGLTVTAALHRARAGEIVTLTRGGTVRPGDGLYLDLETSRPAHIYVIDEDERGQTFVLFPAAGLDLVNPLPAHVRHRLPGTRAGQPFDWQVTSAGGRENFVVVASLTPIEALVRGMADLDAARPGRAVAREPAVAGNEDPTRGIGGMTPSAGTGTGTPGRIGRLLAQIPYRGPDSLWVWQVRLENSGR